VGEGLVSEGGAAKLEEKVRNAGCPISYSSCFPCIVE